MKLIAIVGMPGAGKSVLSEYLITKGFFPIRFGAIVIGEVQRRGLPVTPENEQLVREEMRQQHGMDICAKLALPLIKGKLVEHQRVVIDGLYSLREYTTLRSAFAKEMVVVAVFTPKTLRYQRLVWRRERPLTNAQAEARDFMEVERLEKGGPIALADFTIVNDGSQSQFIAQAEALLPCWVEDKSAPVLDPVGSKGQNAW
jgi:dephospho-CoA kinase